MGEDLAKDVSTIKDTLLQLQERIRYLEGQLGSTKSSAESWRKVGSKEEGDQDDDGSIQQANEEGDDRDDDGASFKLSPDLFSILATSEINSFPFFCSLFLICWFQTIPLILLFVSTSAPYFDGRCTGLNAKNIAAGPEGRFVMGVMICALIVIVPDFMVGSIALKRGLPTHVRGAGRFCKINNGQWVLASSWKATQGILNFCISVILMAVSETVLEVVLNALGITFLSDLDDLFFRRGVDGYLGKMMKKVTREIEEADFRREKSNADNWVDKLADSAIAKNFAVLVMLLLVLILSIGAAVAPNDALCF